MEVVSGDCTSGGLGQGQTGGSRDDMVTLRDGYWGILRRERFEGVCKLRRMCMLSHSVVSDSSQPHGLWSFCPWESPGKNTG